MLAVLDIIKLTFLAIYTKILIWRGFKGTWQEQESRGSASNEFWQQ